MKKLLIPLILASFILAGCASQKSLNEWIFNIKEEQNERYTKTATGIFVNKQIDMNILFNNFFDRLETGQRILADIESFQFLSGWFAKDKNQIFFKWFWLSGIDVSTFQIINNEYIKDKKYVIKIKIRKAGNNDYDCDLYSLYIVSHDPDNFHIIDNQNIKDTKITKKVMIDYLGKEMIVPENRTIEQKKRENNKSYINIITDSFFYVITWSNELKFPVTINIEFNKISDTASYLYYITPEDESKINKWELLSFIYEGESNIGYWIKIWKIPYIISVTVGWNSPDWWEDYYWMIRPEYYWMMVHDDIIEAISSLKN